MQNPSLRISEFKGGVWFTNCLNPTGPSQPPYPALPSILSLMERSQRDTEREKEKARTGGDNGACTVIYEGARERLLRVKNDLGLVN